MEDILLDERLNPTKYPSLRKAGLLEVLRACAMRQNEKENGTNFKEADGDLRIIGEKLVDQYYRAARKEFPYSVIAKNILFALPQINHRDEQDVLSVFEACDKKNALEEHDKQEVSKIFSKYSLNADDMFVEIDRIQKILNHMPKSLSDQIQGMENELLSRGITLDNLRMQDAKISHAKISHIGMQQMDYMDTLGVVVAQSQLAYMMKALPVLGDLLLAESGTVSFNTEGLLTALKVDGLDSLVNVIDAECQTSIKQQRDEQRAQRFAKENAALDAAIEERRRLNEKAEKAKNANQGSQNEIKFGHEFVEQAAKHKNVAPLKPKIELMLHAISVTQQHLNEVLAADVTQKDTLQTFADVVLSSKNLHSVSKILDVKVLGNGGNETNPELKKLAANPAMKVLLEKITSDPETAILFAPALKPEAHKLTTHPFAQQLVDLSQNDFDHFLAKPHSLDGETKTLLSEFSDKFPEFQQQLSAALDMESSVNNPASVVEVSQKQNGQPVYAASRV